MANALHLASWGRKHAAAAGRDGYEGSREGWIASARTDLRMAENARQAAGRVLPMLALLTLGMLAGCAAGHVYTCRTDSECVAECVQAGETDCEAFQ